MFIRKQIFTGADQESLFLWGARQTGKTSLLKSLFPEALWFDLLQTEVFYRFDNSPSQFREVILAQSPRLVIVDEIQKIPALLDEIHWLIENHQTRFILSGSSARKILRSGANLLGGRALRYELYPLVQAEIPDFDLNRALNNGMLPRHYLSNNVKKLLEAYVSNYLRDEIIAEARIRNVQAFAQFLEAAAFSNGELINMANIASDCGVSGPTIKEYFQILEDTLIGRFLPAFQKRPKRRILHAPKFYFFDVGVANHLLKRGQIETKSEAFGHCFEHFIYQEIFAHSKYSNLDYAISYWRTSSGVEVDFVLGDHEIAIEVKSTDNAQTKHAKGLVEFAKDYPVKKLLLVTTDPMERKMGNIYVLPWQRFLEKLWAGEIIK